MKLFESGVFGAGSTIGMQLRPRLGRRGRLSGATDDARLVPASGTPPGPDGRLTGRVGAWALLVGMWLLGLVALGAVIQFDRRVDHARQAQVVIAEMQNQQGALAGIAFAPATSAAASSARGREQNKVQLAEAKQVLSGSVARLAALGHETAPIAAVTQRYFVLVDHLSALVTSGASRAAALEWGNSQRPGGVEAKLAAELIEANASYGTQATRSRDVASVGTGVALLSLLVAFSIAFHHLLRARRRFHRDATTDALTGLGNRRKLFADIERGIASLDGETTLTLAIFDLDGFKAYNDTFGHPAGDALLARLGARLDAAVGDSGSAYRIGGDEFVVTTTDSDHARLLRSAQAALGEQGEGFSIGCSLGSTRVRTGITLEEALHVADQRLYAYKRSTRRGQGSEARDALLQVLAEHDVKLVTHLGHVAALAENTAIRLGLPDEQVELTRLAAELHDVGKSAIPDEILNKPGPLDQTEQVFMERHSAIGERIVAAAPTLAAVAPIIRAAHERFDGNGYPDGLRLEEIPICSRIIAVVDAYDAMTSDRPYRAHLTNARAIAELRRCAGTQFDPTVTDAFISVCKEAFVETASTTSTDPPALISA